MRILWTDTALRHLEEIFGYLKDTANVKTARRTACGIVDRTLTLKQHPRIGAVEEILKDRHKEYRYLVEGNFKIIYSVEDEMLHIAAVFDCRRDPEKMKDSLG